MKFVRCATLLALAVSGTEAQQSHAIVGNLTTTGPVTINGAAMPASVGAALPVADQDRLTNEEGALFTTTEGNRLTFDGHSAVRLGTVEGGQTYVAVSGGGLEFQTKARPVYICIGGRLFVPPATSHGYTRLTATGSVNSHVDGGKFVESGQRGCGDAGLTRFLSGLQGAPGAPPAAGGIAPGVTTGGAGIGTVGKVAVAAGVAVGIGTAAATGLASSTTVSDCTGNIGCNFNPPPPSPSQP